MCVMLCVVCVCVLTVWCVSCVCDVMYVDVFSCVCYGIAVCLRVTVFACVVGSDMCVLCPIHVL